MRISESSHVYCSSGLTAKIEEIKSQKRIIKNKIYNKNEMKKLGGKF
jgi:hypothetical protein